MYHAEFSCEMWITYQKYGSIRVAKYGPEKKFFGSENASQNSLFLKDLRTKILTIFPVLSLVKKQKMFARKLRYNESLMTITIKKRDGSRVPFNADRINKSIERACYGITDPISKVIQIATETRLTLYDGITTEELDIATINAALQNTQKRPRVRHHRHPPAPEGHLQESHGRLRS